MPGFAWKRLGILQINWIVCMWHEVVGGGHGIQNFVDIHHRQPLELSSPCAFCHHQQSEERSKEQASLVAQWLRIRLPMQGTWVRALVRDDPT